MGLSAKAEYTLELIQQPRRSNHITHRFFCTGFLLATSIDEHALGFLMDKWEWIDNITADRIRFLFFLDNEIELGGWPRRPRFSVHAYERAHQQLLRQARELGFETVVRPGEQVDYENGSLVRPWQPDEKVRRLARQLGVESLVPCLVWAFDEHPGVVYARSIENQEADEIAGLIASFAKAFYTENSSTLASVELLEGQLESSCGSLELTVRDLEQLSDLVADCQKVSEILLELHGVNCRPGAQLLRLQTLSSCSKRLAVIASVKSVDVLPGLLARIPRWAKACSAMGKLLGQDNGYIRFQKLDKTFQECMDLTNWLPDVAARPVPPTLPLEREVIEEFLVSFSTKWGTGQKRPPLDRTVEKVRGWLQKFHDGDVSPENATRGCKIALGVLFLARELRKTGISFAGESEVEAIGENLRACFESATLASSVTIQIWLYNQLVDLKTQLQHRIQAALDSDMEGEKLVERASELAGAIEFQSTSIAIPGMRGYREVQLSEPRATSRLSTSRTTNDENVSVLNALSGRLRTHEASRLIPIQLAMDDLRRKHLPTPEENAQSLRDQSIQLTINASGNVGIAERILQVKESHVGNKNEVLIGDNVVFHGDFAVGQKIQGSFNKVASSTATGDLKEKLSQLAEAVAAMCEALPEEKAKDAAEDLDTLVEQATKERPRRSWFDLSAEGLKEAAETVGELGKPILTLVDEIIRFVADQTSS